MGPLECKGGPGIWGGHGGAAPIHPPPIWGDPSIWGGHGGLSPIHPPPIWGVPRHLWGTWWVVTHPTPSHLGGPKQAGAGWGAWGGCTHPSPSHLGGPRCLRGPWELSPPNSLPFGGDPGICGWGGGMGGLHLSTPLPLEGTQAMPLGGGGWGGWGCGSERGVPGRGGGPTHPRTPSGNLWGEAEALGAGGVLGGPGLGCVCPPQPFPGGAGGCTPKRVPLPGTGVKAPKERGALTGGQGRGQAPQQQQGTQHGRARGGRGPLARP